MSADISIGNISTSVVLNLQNLQSGVKEATALINQLGETLQSSLGTVFTRIGEIMGQAGSSASAMGEKMSAATNAAGTQTERFNEQLAATFARLETLKGIDPLAELRQQFKGLVPDSELEKLAFLRNELVEVKAAEQQAANEAREMAQAQAQAARESAANAQAMKQGIAAAGQAASMVGSQLTQFGHEMKSAIEDAVHTAADFSQMLQQVHANTTMTNADAKVMEATIRNLGANSAAPLKELGDGFMHIMNFNFKAKDASLILEAAMKSAISTGGNVSKTAEMLSGVMHQYGMNTTQAGKAMDVLHLSAAQGNQTLEQFVGSTSRAYATGAQMKMSFIEISAALSTMTRAQFSTSMATTQLTGFLNALAHQSAGVRKMIVGLSKETGVDLAKDFTVMGGAARGIPGILDDIRSVAEKTHRPLQQLITDLFPNQRGRILVGALAGNNRADFKEILGGNNDVFSGKKKDVTQKPYEDAQEKLNNQLKQFNNQITLLKADIGELLTPLLLPLLKWAQEAVQWFNQLPQPVKQLAASLAVIATAAALVLGPLLSMAGSIALMLPLLEAIGPAVGAVVAALSGPVGIAIAAVAAAIGLLVVAWRNDWGHIREHTAEFVAWIHPYLTQAGDWLKSVWASAMGYVKDFTQRTWPQIKEIITTVWNATVTGLRTDFELLKTLFAGTWENLVGVLRGAWNVIAGVVKVAFAVVAGIVTIGLDLLTGHWSKAWTDFVHYGEMASKGVEQALRGLHGIISNIMAAIVRVMLNAGKSMVQGLVDGIKSEAGQVADAARGLANSATMAIQNVLQIHSPSRVMHEIGQYVAQGLAMGMLAGLPLVTDAATGLTSAAASALHRLKKVSDETRDAIKAAVEDIYKLTHSDADVQRRQAKQQYGEDLHQHVPEPVAKERRDLTLKKIDAGEEEERAAKRKAAAQSEIDQATWMAEVKASDAKAQQALEEDEAKRRKEANAEELRQETWMAEVKASDAKAQAALEAEGAKARHAAAQQEIDEAIWMAEVKRRDAQAQSELDAIPTKLQIMQQHVHAALMQMRQGVQDILGSAFEKLFNGDTKHWFEDLLHSFEQLLIQMAAKALAAGIVNMLLGGGGGFIGGALSSFGFDDATNDKKAGRFGFDFARHFSEGANNFNNVHKPFQNSGNRSAGDTHNHFNFPNMVVREEADIGKITDAIATRMSSGLSGRFVGNGR